MPEPNDFEYRELPNLSDPALIEICLALEDIHKVGRQLLSTCIQPQNASRVSIGIVFRILDRILSSGRASVLLCTKGFTRDAAVLLVNLVELRLDMQYISQDASREAEWVEHVDKRNRPWKVAQQLKAIFSAPSELDAERKWYEHISMVKHGNPAGGELVHSIWTEGNAIYATLDEGHSRLVPEYANRIGFDIVASCRAAMEILTRHGIDVSQYEQLLKDAHAEIGRILEQRTRDNLNAWLRQTNPDIAALDLEEARLTEKRNKIVDEMRRLAGVIKSMDEQEGDELLEKIAQLTRDDPGPRAS